MGQIFAQPFLANLGGHSDGINVFAKSSEHVSRFVSGDWAGELRYWDLSNKKTMWSVQAHQHFVKGVAFDRTGHNIVSCGNEDVINIFSIRKALESAASRK